MTPQPNTDPSILARLPHLEGTETPKDLYERPPLFDLFRTRGAYLGALSHLPGAESLTNNKGDVR